MGNEISMTDVYKTIKAYKEFLKEARKRTEITPNNLLYYQIIREFYKDRFFCRQKEFEPTMRIATWSKANYIPSSKSADGDRIIFYCIIHNVVLYVSFNIEELAKYILLADTEKMHLWFVRQTLQEYSLKLIDNIKTKHPKCRLKKGDLYFCKYGYGNVDADKIKMASILANYTYIISKRKMLERTPKSRIKAFYKTNN